jgi:hypothetical protein
MDAVEAVISTDVANLNSLLRSKGLGGIGN